VKDLLLSLHYGVGTELLAKAGLVEWHKKFSSFLKEAPQKNNLQDNIQDKIDNIQDNPRPKLTAEVFDRPDCPEWARYAAVNGDNTASWFNDKPIYNGNKRRLWLCKATPYYNEVKTIPGVWDASDWQKSLVQRPAAKLPDWCKVGEWVWINGRPDRLAYNGYGKITQVEPYIDVLMGTDGNAQNTTISLDGLSQARLRPYNAEEMRGLVGKVVCGSEDKTFLVLSYSGNKVFFGEFGHTAEDLTLDIYKFPDGSRCGVLEHLEEGEWVK
jgi:hypothetical protein